MAYAVYEHGVENPTDHYGLDLDLDKALLSYISSKAVSGVIPSDNTLLCICWTNEISDEKYKEIKGTTLVFSIYEGRKVIRYATVFNHIVTKVMTLAELKGYLCSIGKSS